MKVKYPQATLVFQHDNLLSHKNSEIMKVIQADRLEMIYSPSHTPEFSGVENTFADMKRQMGSFQFIDVKKTADEMARILFHYSSKDMQVFVRKTLRNIIDFWKKIDREKLMREVDM